MSVGSSSIFKKKRGDHRPKSHVPKKQTKRTCVPEEDEVVEQEGPSTSQVEDSADRTKVSTADTPRYVPPCTPSAKPCNLMKKQRYLVKTSTIPQGMECTVDTVAYILKMKYDDQYLLASTKIRTYPFVLNTGIKNDPIVYTAHEWAQGLERLGSLGLINMLHFERLVKSNACAKILLPFFTRAICGQIGRFQSLKNLFFQSQGFPCRGPILRSNFVKRIMIKDWLQS